MRGRDVFGDGFYLRSVSQQIGARLARPRLSWARQTGRTFPSTPTVSSYSCSHRPEHAPKHTATIGHPSS
ncbi:hypothetical protein ACOMHN_015523 [Nucella lapillus]